MSGGWICDRDYITPDPADSLNRVGVTGPSGFEGSVRPEAMPIRWRTLDEDGNVYHGGRMNEAALDEFGESDPLHNLSMPDAGAVVLQIRRDDGAWEVV